MNAKNNQLFKFLVDTGASISLIKACKLTPDTYFSSKDKLTLQGQSTNNPVETIKSCITPFPIFFLI